MGKTKNQCDFQKHQFPPNMISFSLIGVSKATHRLRSFKFFTGGRDETPKGFLFIGNSLRMNVLE